MTTQLDPALDELRAETDALDRAVAAASRRWWERVRHLELEIHRCAQEGMRLERVRRDGLATEARPIPPRCWPRVHHDRMAHLVRVAIGEGPTSTTDIATTILRAPEFLGVPHTLAVTRLRDMMWRWHHREIHVIDAGRGLWRVRELPDDATEFPWPRQVGQR